ncbi:MFS transporter [Variovorax ureilyticus]|uniref:MFS transporter n=1 Tax=Variovorax ureilyticus TaxID=1836198 RepID=UPI003D667C0A
MTTTTLVSPHPADATIDADEHLYRKISWRILPLLFLAYIVSYLDRVNIGYAQLQMKDALGFSTAAFGVGAGIMFLGYCLFEVPSNILLERIGARKTFLRIMVLWGLTASATMFVTTPLQFYVVRFMLGVFEAGFFPGVILYMTYWYPPARRGRMVAIFSSAPVVAGIIAGP